MREIVLDEERLRFLEFEQLANAAHVAAAQKIRVLTGFAIARAGDNRVDLRRRAGVLRARFWPVFGEGLLALARWHGLSHGSSSTETD
jgi:hypothetical protein